MLHGSGDIVDFYVRTKHTINQYSINLTQKDNFETGSKEKIDFILFWTHESQSKSKSNKNYGKPEGRRGQDSQK